VAIQYRAPGTSGAGSASVTTQAITLPTGWAAGDWLSVVLRIGASTVTGFSQTAGTGSWTIRFSAGNSTGGFYYAVADRLMVAGDTAPTFSWTTGSTVSWSCGGFYSDASLVLSLLGYAAGDPSQNSTAGNSVTPNPITVTGAGSTASIILTGARASASGAVTSHTFTPPTGWTWNDGDLGFFGTSGNARICANCYQLGVAGTVTPGAESLTDSSSHAYFFDVFHALVQEAAAASILPQQTQHRFPARFTRLAPVRAGTVYAR
jgi:hypothetical protein